MKLFKKFLPIVLVLSLTMASAAFALVGDSIAKDDLSGSTDGRMIKITGTDSAGAVIVHTAVASATDMDEIYIWIFNAHTDPVEANIEWGVHADAADLIKITIPNDAGVIMVIPGWVLKNSLTIEIFATTTADVLFIGGYVHHLTGG